MSRHPLPGEPQRRLAQARPLVSRYDDGDRVPNPVLQEEGMPEWMQPLLEAIAASMSAHGPESPLGLRYRQLDDVWDLLVYPMPVEMVGGAHDGGRASPGFSLDLEALHFAIDRITSVEWDAHGCLPDNDGHGPCIAIRGNFAGRQIWLRILADAPADVEAAVKVDTTSRTPNR
jgi:hypothetical protein